MKGIVMHLKKGLLAGALFSSASVLVSAASEEPLKVYFMGHSLVYHTEHTTTTGSKDYTSLPYWMDQIAQAEKSNVLSDGQFGYARSHAELPPKPQWGFEMVDSAWTRSFPDTKYDAAVLTTLNFIQYQAVHKPYHDDKKVSPLDATVTIVDYMTKNAPETTFYLFENWPDMGEFAPEYPPKEPSASKVKAYYSHIENDFHDWWVHYHDALIKIRPKANVKMIPVGPVLAKLLTQTPLKNIPFGELYEDNAPHGRPNIYFLAALIHYIAITGEEAPAGYKVPDLLHPLLREHYALTAKTIWDELNAFKDEKGQNRVFK